MHAMTQFLTRLILALALVGQASSAASATSSKPSLPPPLPEAVLAATAEQQLHLLGYGHMRKFFMDVFDASLWVSGTQFSFDRPFVLELRYARKMKGQDIVDTTLDQWKHLGYTDKEKLEGWKQQITKIFPDVKTGDQLLGLYTPNDATRFFLNGNLIGEVKDPAFGPAFFAIWLDEKTSQPALRMALLGDTCAKPSMVIEAGAKPCSGATSSDATIIPPQPMKAADAEGS